MVEFSLSIMDSNGPLLLVHEIIKSPVKPTKLVAIIKYGGSEIDQVHTVMCEEVFSFENTSISSFLPVISSGQMEASVKFTTR